jgi:carbamoyl-phosphate synthase large subunit
MRILLTGACGVTSRAIARSLRMSTKFPGLVLIGTDICDNPYGLYEGLYDRIYRAPRVDETGYDEWMKDVCSREGIEAAIVVPELEVLYWSAADFPVRVALPPAQFCRIAVSKGRLYRALEGANLVPGFRIVARTELADAAESTLPEFPCWIRDFSEGTSSGKGSLLARNVDEIRAWAVLNPRIPHFLLSDFLPGRNFACHLLYDGGTLVKIASYERLEYFMARTAMSGVTGNISRGRLINDERLVAAAQKAVARVLADTQETMHGLIAVDFKEARSGEPLITEINLRHVAATSAFAAAGFNLSEAQLLVALGRIDELGAREMVYPSGNVIFRDIDGVPVWLRDYRKLAVGEFIGKLANSRA